MSVERREARRINLPCSVVLSLDGKIISIDTFTQNVSGKGLKLALEERLSLQCIVGLSLSLNEVDPPLRCQGSVVWVNPRNDSSGMFDTGIKFLNMPADQIRQIEETVALFLKR